MLDTCKNVRTWVYRWRMSRVGGNDMNRTARKRMHCCRQYRRVPGVGFRFETTREKETWEGDQSAEMCL